jgi:hypothetical protein
MALSNQAVLGLGISAITFSRGKVAALQLPCSFRPKPAAAVLNISRRMIEVARER